MSDWASAPGVMTARIAATSVNRSVCDSVLVNMDETSCYGYGHTKTINADGSVCQMPGCGHKPIGNDENPHDGCSTHRFIGHCMELEIGYKFFQIGLRIG